MAAELLNDRLARNEAALAGQVYKDSLNTSIWNKLINKEPWPDGMADTLTVLTTNRNLPANIDSWTGITPNINSNTCVPIADVVPRGSTLRYYTLEQKALESEDLCVEDGRNAFEVETQVKNMYDNFRDVIAYTWKRKAILEYTRISEHKVVAAPGLPESASHMPNIAATSQLTNKILRRFYVNLLSNSAQLDGGSLGMADGRPQFILVTDAETSDELFEDSNTREAMLWNSKRVPELLEALGVDRPLKGFYHTIDPLPRRWNFTGGVWVEAMPYETVAATNGYKSELRAEYLSAPFTDSYIFLPSVFSFMVPGDISTLGGGTSFASYIGKVKWHNEYNRETNPDSNQGYYRAVLKSGSKPVKPQFGHVIRHLRCAADLGFQACAVSPGGISGDLGSDEAFTV